MKHIFLFILLLSCSQRIASMYDPGYQGQSCQISISNPEFNPRNGKYMIELFDESENRLPIGHISYLKKTGEPDTWVLDIFRVHSDYRKNGLGTILFTHCVDHIKRLEGKILTWEAQPLDFRIELATLIKIYQNLVLKSGFSGNALTITVPDRPSYAKFVTMRLRLV